MQGALDTRAKLASPARKEDEERDEKRLSKADRTARPTSSATFSTASVNRNRHRQTRQWPMSGIGSKAARLTRSQNAFSGAWKVDLRTLPTEATVGPIHCAVLTVLPGALT